LSASLRRRLHAGNFPLWLAPDQVRVITLNDDEALIAYAKPIVAELRANMVRVDADFSATPFKAKISAVTVGHDVRSAAPNDSLPRRLQLQKGSWRGERASPPRRPARRAAEGGSGGGYSGEHQRAAGVMPAELRWQV
jgi:hypothetical protein